MAFVEGCQLPYRSRSCPSVGLPGLQNDAEKAMRCPGGGRRPSIAVLILSRSVEMPVADLLVGGFIRPGDANNVCHR